MSAGRRRRWPMSCAIHANIPTRSFRDLATNNVAKFTKDQVAFVYGSLWKQRYFTKVGDDYYPSARSMGRQNQQWQQISRARNGGDWWTAFYPSDNMQRPTGPTCDGCHSVGYDIHTKQVAEWNVGCERCHGPGSEHVAHPIARQHPESCPMDYVAANDTCIQCHSQGQPLPNPIEGKYYDWPVGYHVGLRLPTFGSWKTSRSARPTSTAFPDGTAHKNRMQGNDFAQSVMYRRGITCSLATMFMARTITPNCGNPGISSASTAMARPRQWPSDSYARRAHSPQRRQHRKPMRGLPHADNRD